MKTSKTRSFIKRNHSFFFLLAKTIVLYCFFFFIFISFSQGAIPPKILKGSDSFRGGKAGTAFSLLDVRKSSSLSLKTERIVIDVGDAILSPLKGVIAYHNIEMKENPPRIIIDFSQTLNSKFTEKILEKKFKQSLYVKKANLFFDKISQSMNITFNLKQKVKAKVYNIDGSKETAKLVIDLSDESK